MITTSISERIVLPGIAISFAILFLTLLFGRFFCGWLCPLGASIDIAGALRRGSDSGKDSVNERIMRVKFYILVFIGLFALAGRQHAWVFDPIVIAARFVSLNLIPAATFLLNSFFIVLLKNMDPNGFVADFYHALKPAVLGVKVYYFSHSAVILAFFLSISFASLAMKRLWCRMLCPLGALYAFIARFAPFCRIVERCTSCRICKSDCRMGAIKDDLSYAKGECILCMDCVYDCPEHATKFGWNIAKKIEEKGAVKDGGPHLSRKGFLFLLFSPFLLLGSRHKDGAATWPKGVIRPPAALKEEDFLDRCVRCGNCMKVCITNGLQPVIFQAGLEGIWTPQLVPEIGYCEYHCTLCGNTCPTGAIPPLTGDEKIKTRLGVAEINRSLCLPWAQNKECIVCQEHCPVPDKAIKLIIETVGVQSMSKPYIDENLCIGCGICQNKCPVRPVRAVRVSPRDSDRT